MILFLQRISQLKTRQELTKQGNLDVFFTRFFKIIITFTILAPTKIAFSSSPSPVRLFQRLVLLKNFSSCFLLPPTPLNRNNPPVVK